ncbi:serine/threonine protein kinase [uncultured Ferrimonas sp.]|uniref:serine/threonine protein kinase n=1 Tax=uncultured Ferrimonas sp. TaxID=432640 RepID=UPI002604322C|nr:serine/threonine protein kinase [uncultured Ferrimonas sp.]
MSRGQFDFQSLGPDLMLDAIEALGVYPDSGLLALNSYENRVYQFRADDGQRYVTKFYRPQRWSAAQICEEHQYALELADAEVPVAAPMAFGGDTLFEHQGYYYALWRSVGGRQFEVDNLDQLEQVGRFLGRLHQQGQKRDFAHRPTLSITEFGHDAKTVLQQQAQIGGYLETAFYTVLDQLLQRIAEPLAQKQPFLRLHGDMHPGNILYLDDGPSFVDLDDARMGPAIQDLWMMLNGDRSQRLVQLDVLLEGYDTFATLPSSQLALIEPLRALRMINYLAWLTKRWQDPAFPRNFPWFGTDKFWEEQVLAMKEQLAALDEMPLSLSPGQGY